MSFYGQVYRLLLEVPTGRVTTYKAIARKLGGRAYRLVGQALKNNPYAPTVPCHRVVMSDGTLGGFNGEKEGSEIQKKIDLLRSEGVKVSEKKIVNFEEVFYDFKN